jgi:hypothetical protein
VSYLDFLVVTGGMRYSGYRTLKRPCNVHRSSTQPHLLVASFFASPSLASSPPLSQCLHQLVLCGSALVDTWGPIFLMRRASELPCGPTPVEALRPHLTARRDLVQLHGPTPVNPYRGIDYSLRPLRFNLSQVQRPSTVTVTMVDKRRKLYGRHAHVIR